uniref:Uncharacterized protein n=1 Tax=Manihot esculenta TaxID=3983 RepID=A0A2C9VDN0_MANES
MDSLMISTLIQRVHLSNSENFTKVIEELLFNFLLAYINTASPIF